MPVLPLTADETKEYNNVATTPPTAPLGDIINELDAGGGGGIPPPVGALQGDILFFDGVAWDNLVPGAIGTVLTSNGAGATPTYQPNPSGIEDVADIYDCAAGVAVNEAVFISASNTVAEASAVAGGGQTKPAIGIVVSKPTAITAKVVSAGSQLVTSFAGLTPGSQYWLSPVTPGAITLTPPSTVGQALQPIGKAITATKLLVEIGESTLL